MQDGNTFRGVILGFIVTILASWITYYVATHPTPGDSPAAPWILGLFIIVGLAILFGTSSISVIIDKAHGTVTFGRKRLTGTKSVTYNTADALRVELRQGIDIERGGGGPHGGGSARQVYDSQSVLVFKNGDEMPLENQKRRDSVSVGLIGGTGIMLSGKGRELSISRQVATFMGIPFEEVGNPGPVGIGSGGIQP